MLYFLIGLPGSGKTTLGRLLARSLQVPFVDTDHVIEDEEGMPVTEIFAQRGEAEFRLLEKQALLNVIQRYKDAVISVGGGTPCYYDNMHQMNAAGITIYLEVNAAAIYSRIKGEGLKKRPMFADMDGEQVVAVLKQKIEERNPYYKQSHVIISDDNIQLIDILSRL